jgi:hypothetical protein
LIICREKFSSSSSRLKQQRTCTHAHEVCRHTHACTREQPPTTNRSRTHVRTPANPRKNQTF